jgi:hypothetical protein
LEKVVKLHLLRHLADTIRWHRTWVSTQAMEHEHRVVKRGFEVTNKQNSSAVKQVLAKVHQSSFFF